MNFYIVGALIVQGIISRMNYTAGAINRTTPVDVVGLTPTTTSVTTPIATHISLTVHFATAPTVDGIIDASEWSSASGIPITFSTPSGATFSGRVFVMRELTILYFAFWVADKDFGRGKVTVVFDNNNNGYLDTGADVVSTSHDRFSDSHWNETGHIDGNEGNQSRAAASRVEDQNHFELAHPLCSREVTDICVADRQTLGFILLYLDSSEKDTPIGASP